MLTEKPAMSSACTSTTGKETLCMMCFTPSILGIFIELEQSTEGSFVVQYYLEELSIREHTLVNWII